MAETVGTVDRLRYFLVAVGVGVLGLIVGIFLTLIALLALQGTGRSVGPWELIVVSLLLTQGVGMGGVAITYLNYRERALEFVRVRFPTLRGWIWTGAGYVLALGSVFTAAAIVFVVAGAPQTENQVVEIGRQEPAVLLLMIPGSFLLIGPGEELLFRGIVQGKLREAFGPVSGISMASLIFASVHVVAYTGSPLARLAGVVVLFFPSLVLGIAYERTNNIVVPSLIHGAYNATLFALLYVSIQFGGSP